MKKPLILTLIVALVFAAVVLPASALGTAKSILATYGVQIDYNGRILTGSPAPFIVNGSTYVPLRMLMETFGDKNITWDAASQKVMISSRLGPMDNMYMQQITLQNLEITNLQTQNKQLAAENAKLKNAQNDVDYIEGELEDLSDDLTKLYEDYDGKDFTLTVTGNEQRIELVVDADEHDWDNFTEAEQEDFMEAVCDDIWEDFSKAVITGFIEDNSDTLAQFKVEPDKSVNLVAALDISEIEADLNDDYGDYNSMSIDITLSGNEDKITMAMTVKGTQWNALTTTVKEDLLDDINGDIWYVLEDADINGTIKDGSTTLNSYHVESDDRVDL